MVKIQAFKGYTYKSQDYHVLLRFDHQSLEDLPQSKRTFIKKVSIRDQIQSGLIERDNYPFFYIYKQIYRGKQTLGVMAQLDLNECFMEKIKVHELTLCRKGYDYISYSQSHVGPIILSYKTPSKIIEEYLLDISNNFNPYSKWSTIDGREHTLWKFPSDKLAELFDQIDCLYVLDGHHRLKAAIEWFKKTELNFTARFTQVLIYPSTHVSIFPIHRLLSQSQQYNFLKHVKKKRIEHDYMKQADQSTLKHYDILYKTRDGYYGFNLQNNNQTQVGKLAVSKLKVKILDELYGQDLENKIKFIPGIMNWNQLNGKYHTICMVKPIKIEDIFKVADKNQIMPPKSTWFQPKPCNHMVIRLPFQL